MADVPFTDVAVLIVDDDPDMRLYLRRSLGRLGLNRIFEAHDGAEALYVARNLPIDLIICQNVLPGMGSQALVHALEADEDTRRIRYISLSARKEAPAGGADTSLLVPFNAETLRGCLADLLDSNLISSHPTPPHVMPHTFKERYQAVIIEVTDKFLGSKEGEDIARRVDAYIAQGYSNFVIDLSAAKFLDSTAIGVLLQVRQKAQSAGGDAKLAALKKQVRGVFIMTKLLGSAFEEYDSVDAAASSFPATA